MQVLPHLPNPSYLAFIYPGMIQLHDVTVKLRGQPIFHQLNVRFESEISYLIDGKNGAGKTTLLNLLAGKIQPHKGVVHYNFIDDTLEWDEKYALRKKYIHFVPAQALHELINVPESFYQQRYYSIEESPSPVTVRGYLGTRLQNLVQLQLPDSFQLQNLLDLDITRLSNGQVKKIIILKQLLNTIPKILLLDYPFEGLDAKSRMALSEFLDHLTTVYPIQLIIADHKHDYLPRTITQRMLLGEAGISMAICSRPNLPADIKSENLTAQAKNETPPVVEMRNLTIQYGDKVIIDKLNWKIVQGERWALTGPNGSGKTTLFSMIYADHPMAYSEKVFLFGKRRGSGESIWDIKKRISYLGPEQLHFLDHVTAQFTAREYLKKVKAPNERLNQLIALFQAEALLPKRLQQLSNGQLQLVLLLALFLAPKELLLLDEPFQFLDPQQKKSVTNYLLSFLEDSATLVLITHYEDDVNRWTHHRLSL